MILLLDRLFPNPLPDFKDKPLREPLAIEISDEDIVKIGERYFELKKPNPSLERHSHCPKCGKPLSNMTYKE